MYPWLQPTFSQLSSRISANKLHHALLLQGADGIGKDIFALTLAKLLLCQDRQGEQICGRCQSCKLNASETHPDLYKIESEKQIGVDLVREAIKNLTGTAQMSGAKVLIIYRADSMTESSANALLKTLEEPTDNTFLLLITEKPESILPTILSRCEKQVLPSPSLENTLDWVKQHHQGDIDENFARLFVGRPLTLLDELQQEQSFNYQDFITGIQGVMTGNLNAIQLATDWQSHTGKVIKWLQAWVKQSYLSTQKEGFWRINLLCIAALKKLKNPGVNKTLTLAELLAALANFESN
ncbi:DNA polymerase III subunit delta' [uncultured Paraglaciecola sp.]|uniref:DNA polymerase III subunit delta' n=1 Tax=uncultured Paraglaciecola sp. TaxID=1765024 RepID=UPI002596F6EB|nr:DNA polymerase III subunit delta' [uncultured Paraglaciecola sp.]